VTRQRSTNRSGATSALAVLPRVVVRPDGLAWLTVTLDGAEVCDGPIPCVQLGEALGQIIEQIASPVRVEVHEPDGTVYADIIATPPEASVLPDCLNRADRPGGFEVVVEGGFLPGEPVHLAVTSASATADATGRVTAHVDPRHAAGGGRLIVSGAVSGTTLVNEPS
jgi:hypothetical protein